MGPYFRVTYPKGKNGTLFLSGNTVCIYLLSLQYLNNKNTNRMLSTFNNLAFLNKILSIARMDLARNLLYIFMKLTVCALAH